MFCVSQILLEEPIHFFPPFVFPTFVMSKWKSCPSLWWTECVWKGWCILKIPGDLLFCFVIYFTCTSACSLHEHMLHLLCTLSDIPTTGGRSTQYWGRQQILSFPQHFWGPNFTRLWEIYEWTFLMSFKGKKLLGGIHFGWAPRC